MNVVSGANTINAMAGADTVFAGPGATVTTVNQSGSASVFFQGSDAPSSAVDWFVGGTGGATIVGGANHVAVDVNSNTGMGAVFIAGTGAETLFGAFSATDDAYWGSFSGGSDLMFAGSGNDALVAGGGAQTLAGGSGSNTFYLINPAVVGSIVHAAEPAGFYTVYNAHKGDTIALTGYNSLYGGAGSAAASVSASLAAGASVVRLNDGTVVNFVGASARGKCYFVVGDTTTFICKRALNSLSAPEGRRGPGRGGGDASSRRTRSKTPSKFSITSLFQNRMTRYPCAASSAERAASSTASATCWPPSSSMTNLPAGQAKSAMRRPIGC